MNALTQVPVKRAATPAARPNHSLFAVLQREVDRLFDDFSHGEWPQFGDASAVVRMDMAETKDAFEITAELPGMEDKDVQVSLADRRLTISGEKHGEKEEKDKNYHFVERSYGSFSRSIELPADAQADKIQATIAKGVLKVTIPRAVKAEPKKIAVRSAA